MLQNAFNGKLRGHAGDQKEVDVSPRRLARDQKAIDENCGPERLMAAATPRENALCVGGNAGLLCAAPTVAEPRSNPD
jgi:hypothetical protein